MTDPRRAATLDEACANGDGTYNGVRMLSWLSEVLIPGRGMSVAEVRQIAAEVQAKAQTNQQEHP
ncbi:hypothetical protein F3I16_16030 [Pseudomonas sp. L-22-4S-12]|uniref:hypothetical protein n=1 Tax=Pseudomonas sp. L-22-4S-12 TaxID=2610893 RepID=UPI0013260CD1|nr:hypothetical protein [Pseudomonas sp. L-22-4S-12]MWV17551.1 hypothetical protein [Pseudomonas sp. L-22-4S-12]